MSRRQRDGHDVFEHEYEGVTSTLRAARNDVVAWLAARDVDQDLQDRAQLVLSELATNAVQASPGTPYVLRLSMAEAGSVVMAVTSASNAGTPPPRESWGPATTLAARGRGLLIVGRLSAEVDVEQPADGTVVVTATLRSGANV